jgi:hypothetical protein
MTTRKTDIIVYGDGDWADETQLELMRLAFGCEAWLRTGNSTGRNDTDLKCLETVARTKFGDPVLVAVGFDLSDLESLTGNARLIHYTDAMEEASKWYLCAGGEPPNMSDEERAIYEGVNALCALSHRRAMDAGWYHNLSDGTPKEMNFGERCMLMVSEITEAFEAERKSMVDDKLPDRCGQEVEFADTLVRIADTSGHREYDLGGAIIAKMRFNLIRPDHKKKNRAAAGGKAF